MNITNRESFKAVLTGQLVLAGFTAADADTAAARVLELLDTSEIVPVHSVAIFLDGVKVTVDLFAASVALASPQVHRQDDMTPEASGTGGDAS